MRTAILSMPKWLYSRKEWWSMLDPSRVDLEHFYASVRKALTSRHGELYWLDLANMIPIDEPGNPTNDDNANHDIVHVLIELAAAMFGFYVESDDYSRYNDGVHYFNVKSRPGCDIKGYLTFLRWATPRLLHPAFIDLFYGNFYSLVMHETTPTPDGIHYFMIAGFSMNIAKEDFSGWNSFNSDKVCYLIGKYNGEKVWEYRKTGSFPTDFHDYYRLPTEYHSGLDVDPRDTPAIEADMRDPVYHDKQHWEAEWSRLLQNPEAWEMACGLEAMRIPDKIYPFK